MPVSLPNAVDVPARTYDRLWIRELRIVMPAATVGSVLVRTSYMTADGVIGDDGPTLTTDHFPAAMAGSAALQTAMGAVLNAFDDLQAFVAAEEAALQEGGD